MSSSSPSLVYPLRSPDELLSSAGLNPADSVARPGQRMDSVYLLSKRAIDLVGAVSGMILLFPLMALIAVFIRLSSQGPILFRQTRLGKDGIPFTIYKFRTMVCDAEQRLAALESQNESEGGVLFKLKNDPRVFWFGRLLRRLSLDELPQIFNILRGEMSLVGPRPLQLRDCRLLAEANPIGFARRLEVLPGLTGLWQIRGRSENRFRAYAGAGPSLHPQLLTLARSEDPRRYRAHRHHGLGGFLMSRQRKEILGRNHRASVRRVDMGGLIPSGKRAR